MPNKLEKKFNSTIKPSVHPYLNGAWTPSSEEYTATDMEVIGTIPEDIDGVYVRNTENPVHEAKGNYHPFDGDGMLHSVSFKDGKEAATWLYFYKDGKLDYEERYVDGVKVSTTKSYW